jgi:RNA polymerase sigma-70 factor (ECF subfamily)
MTTPAVAEAELAHWLEESYQRSYRTAYLLLRNRADAQEAVQEAFLRAWRFRASLDAGSNIAPWLYRVVVNSCCSKLRQERPRRDRHAEEGDLAALASTATSPEDLFWHAEVSREIVHALAELPLHLRVAVVLRYYGDLGERDIAIAIGRRPGTVKSRLHEARRRLAESPGLRALALDQEGGSVEAVR